MCWYEIQVEPRDVLFFRDAKPMEASSVGEGARWPWPNILHDSLMAAFHKRWPDPQEWEFKHKNKNGNDKNWDTSSMRFGGLKSVGVFPALDAELCFPKPADISKDGTACADLTPRKGKSDLPGFLEYTVLGDKKEGKESAGNWMGAAEMDRYIAGKDNYKLIPSGDLFDNESRFGIGVDPETGSVDKGSQDQSGKLYIAEYLRLKKNAGIKGFGMCTASVRNKDKTDVMQKFFGESQRERLIFGGQRGVAAIEAVRSEKPTPFGEFDPGDSKMIKWVLLAPAIFSKGWLPGWVDSKGNVCLPSDKPERKPGESREEWRARFGGPIEAKLVAARLDKPRPFSGWSLAKGGPRATRLAVPAGSVYYFRCTTSEDCRALVKALQGKPKSDYFGEKGFGFGFCAPVDVE